MMYPYRKYLLAPFVGLVLCIVLGAVIDRSNYCQPLMFTALHLVGLSGIALGLWFRWPQLESSFERAGTLVLAYLGWRISYFPLMVFAGHGASIGELVITYLPVVPVVIYPTFFIALFTMNTAVAVVASLFVKLRPWFWYGAVAPPLVMACLISFTAVEDLHPLPDRFLTLDRPLPPTVRARENPYYPALSQDLPIHRKPLVFAAGTAYATIPETPWAGVVKGVLETDFKRDPLASSTTRVAEHYLAYACGHPFIGLVELPTSSGH